MSIVRHQLPGGAWADLRDPAEVPERLRRPVRAIQMRLAKDPAFSSVVQDATAKGVQQASDIDDSQAVAMMTAMGDEAAGLLDELNDRLIVSRVVGWSFEAPVGMDALLDLPGPVYDQLRELCAEGALQSGPDFSPSTDPESPTAPSTVSG